MSRMHDVKGRILVLCATALVGCGGSTTSGSAQKLGNAGSGGAGAGETSGGSPSDGGRTTAKGGSSPSSARGSATSGGTEAAGGRGGASPGGAGAPPAPGWDGGINCPIRKTGTVLTEADCYACIDPTCMTSVPVPGFQQSPAIDECVGFVRANTTFDCRWYADANRFDQQWGVVSVTCKTTGGTIYCGGGL